MLLMYAIRRRYVARLLGSLMILEQTAFPRFHCLVRAFQRIGNIPEEVTYYQRLHATLDEKHGDELIHQVCLPLIQKSPKFLLDLCRGILIRREVAQDYYHSIQTRLKTL